MPVAVITGASRGLGRALATELARHAAGSSCWTLATPRASQRSAQLPGGPHLALAGDVTDPGTGRPGRRRRSLGGADLLVNNASTLGASPLPALRRPRPGDVPAILRGQRGRADRAGRDAAAPAAATRSGRVLNITSDAAVEPYETWGGYGSSKAALDHASRVLAAEEPALRVYAVDPGDMRTAMHQAAFPGEDISDRPEPADGGPGAAGPGAGDLPSGRYRAADLAEVAA